MKGLRSGHDLDDRRPRCFLHTQAPVNVRQQARHSPDGSSCAVPCLLHIPHDLRVALRLLHRDAITDAADRPARRFDQQIISHAPFVKFFFKSSMEWFTCFINTDSTAENCTITSPGATPFSPSRSSRVNLSPYSLHRQSAIA